MSDITQAAHGLDRQNHTPEQPDCTLSTNQRTWRCFNLYVFLRTLYLEIKSTCNPKFLLCQRTKLFPNVVAKSCKIKQKSTEINPKATLSVQKKEKRGKI